MTRSSRLTETDRASRRRLRRETNPAVERYLATVLAQIEEHRRRESRRRLTARIWRVFVHPVGGSVSLLCVPMLERWEIFL